MALSPPTTPQLAAAGVNEFDRLHKWLNTHRILFQNEVSVLHLPCSHQERDTLFFVHDFGGQALQWAKQLLFFHERVHLVAIDLPGHGHSPAPDSASRYTAVDIVGTLRRVFHHFSTARNVLIGHSYGTSLVVQLYQSLPTSFQSQVVGLVCCNAVTQDASCLLQASMRALSLVPTPVLGLIRRWQARRGSESQSVARMVAADATNETKVMQLHWNTWTPTHVLQAMAAGLQVVSLADYARVTIPVLLLAGAEDTVVPPEHTYSIYDTVPRVHGPHIAPNAKHNLIEEASELVNALLTTFLIKKGKMSYLEVSGEEAELDDEAPDGKWALKNHAKWKTTPPSSKVLGANSKLGGLIVCKTFRQDDKDHGPKAFKTKFTNVGLVIDVSREPPPYLTNAPDVPPYVKIATVSKREPEAESVAKLHKVLDNFWANPDNARKDVIIHCHYGFNRSGFMACSYLVKRRGFGAREALHAFRKARPPGIKHEHFRAEFLRRYASVNSS